MKVMVIGSGGREHAMVWALRRSAQVNEVLAAPGSAGMAREARCLPVAADDVDGLAALARQEQPDLVLVGPELPLTLGVVDRLQAAGIPAFGPTAACARLEGSKHFAKQFMEKYRIPTAASRTVASLEEGFQALEAFGLPVVVKADGLAAGKGVTVAPTRAEAEAALRQIFEARVFGPAGDRVVIEECLAGEEASVLALCDGRTAAPLLPAQDHKRVFDNDEGPNTGGMGAYAPAPAVTPEIMRRVQQEILDPVMAGMAKEGTPYHGVLYAGLMLTSDGPKVIEFNCRFGDPETQAVLPLLASDLSDLALACVKGQLAGRTVEWKPGAAVCVVLAAPGYPASYPKGLAITGLTEAELIPEITVWHAGTDWQDGRWVTQGGRVLNVVARAETLAQAVNRAYQAANRIQFKGMHYRRDIAQRALVAGAQAAR
ncbi:MAG: phosphoribosylamine--glycine ligase [candidate division FCPU426 bacterium]